MHFPADDSVGIFLHPATRRAAGRLRRHGSTALARLSTGPKPLSPLWGDRKNCTKFRRDFRHWPRSGAKSRGGEERPQYAACVSSGRHGTGRAQRGMQAQQAQSICHGHERRGRHGVHARLAVMACGVAGAAIRVCQGARWAGPKVLGAAWECRGCRAARHFFRYEKFLIRGIWPECVIGGNCYHLKAKRTVMGGTIQTERKEKMRG